MKTDDALLVELVRAAAELSASSVVGVSKVRPTIKVGRELENQ